MKRKLRRRRGKAPPDMAVAAQPGAQPWLHGIGIIKGTTAQDYAERSVPATLCSFLHLNRLSSLAFLRS